MAESASQPETSRTRRFDARVRLPGEAALQLAVEIFLPPVPSSAPAAFFCLPGGGMNRRFFDLLPADGDDSYSFARQMAARGHVVITADHLGVGDSSRPADGYQLTPWLLADAHAQVLPQVLQALREGSWCAELDPLPQLRSIGLGHSMGAMITAWQQAVHRQHEAVVLLGFGTKGLPRYLKPEVAELARSDMAAARARLPELAREFFGEAYTRLRRSNPSEDIYAAGKADPKGVEGLKRAVDVLLTVPSLLSMLPGNIAQETARIEVPVFLGIGEHDMAGRPHEVPASFGGSRDLTLHILQGAGHSHFLFASRTTLYDRLDDWARSSAVAG